MLRVLQGGPDLYLLRFRDEGRGIRSSTAVLERSEDDGAASAPS